MCISVEIKLRNAISEAHARRGTRRHICARAYIYVHMHVARARPVGGRVRALTRRQLGAAASDLVEAIRSKTSEFSASLPYSFVCEVTRVLREFLLKKESLRGAC